MPLFERPGLALHYELLGDGPPLLLHPGLASDHASWAPVLPALMADFRLILPDPRGAGRSAPVAPFGFADLADDLAALLDHLGIARAHLLGHSLGGMVALDFAHRHGGRIDKLVLAATLAGATAFSSAVFGGLLRARRGGLPLADWLRLVHPWLMAPAFFADPKTEADAIALQLGYPHFQGIEGYMAQLRATAGLDLAATLPAIAAPTLVLAAERDLLFPPAEVAAALAALPRQRMETLAGAAHALHWDQPQAFAAAVRGFLLDA